MKLPKELLTLILSPLYKLIMNNKSIRIANAPCSWGVLEFDQFTTTVSYAHVLAEIAKAGYSGTELGDWGFMPTDPTELRVALERHGLDMVGGFVQVSLRASLPWERGRRRWIENRAAVCGRRVSRRLHCGCR